MDKFIAFVNAFMLSAFITFQCLTWHQVKQMPFFSIIISVYNYEEYIGETLKSVLSSNYPYFEVIVVNDGSTDDSLQVIQKYAEKDKRVKVINQENQGLSLARNNAMKIAKGDYFWFVDADDYISHLALSVMAKQIKLTKNPDLISFMIQPITSEGEFMTIDGYSMLPTKLLNYRRGVFNGRDLSTTEMIGYPVTSGKQIYSGKFLKQHDIWFIPHLVFEDDVFFLSIIEANARGTAIFEPLYFKRTHSKSIVSNRDKYYGSVTLLPRLIYEEVKRMQSSEERARAYFDIYFDGVFSKFPGNEKDIVSLKGLLSWLKDQPKDAFFDEKITLLENFINAHEKH